VIDVKALVRSVVAATRTSLGFALQLCAFRICERRQMAFARVVVAPAGDDITAPPPIPAIEIEFPGEARVRIPASVSPALATAVVAALARR
jgi:hypothetical protein